MVGMLGPSLRGLRCESLVGRKLFECVGHVSFLVVACLHNTKDMHLNQEVEMQSNRSGRVAVLPSSVGVF